MLWENSFSVVQNLWLVHQSVKETPKQITELIAIWKQQQHDIQDNDQQTFAFLERLITEGRENPKFFKGLDNMVAVQTVIDFILERVSSLTGQLRALIQAVDARGEVHLTETEFELHQQTERTIIAYLKKLNTIYPLHSSELGLSTFQQHGGAGDISIAQTDGLADTLFWSFQIETTFLVFNTFKLFKIFENRDYSKNSDLFHQNVFHFNRFNGILSTYLEFMFDNRALALHNQMASFHRDQPYSDDIFHWKRKHEEFITQAFFENHRTPNDPNPFTDDLDLQISCMNSTQIRSVKATYTDRFAHQLVAKRIFREQRNLDIKEILYCQDPYFYILSENIRIMRSIESIDQRKWIPLIWLQIRLNGALRKEDPKLPQEPRESNRIMNEFLLISTLERGLGQDYDEFLLQSLELGEITVWIDIEQQLLTRHKQTIFKQAGLQTYYLEPLLRFFNNQSDIFFKPFSIDRSKIDHNSGTIYLELSDTLVIDFEAAIIHFSNYVHNNPTLAYQNLQFVGYIIVNQQLYQENKIHLLTNSLLGKQLEQLSTFHIHFIKLLVYAILYFNQQGKYQRTKDLLRLMNAIVAKSPPGGCKEYQEIYSLWYLFYFDFVMHPMVDNLFDFDFLLRGSFCSQNKTIDKLKLLRQTNFEDKMVIQKTDAERRIYYPYFLQAPESLLNEQFTQTGIMKNAFDRSMKYLDEGKIDYSIESSRMVIHFLRLFGANSFTGESQQQYFVLLTKYILQCDNVYPTFFELTEAMLSKVATMDKSKVDTFVLENYDQVAINLVILFAGQNILCDASACRRYGNNFRKNFFKLTSSINDTIKEARQFEFSQFETFRDISSLQIVRSYFKHLALTEAARSKSLQKHFYQTKDQIIKKENSEQFSFEEVTDFYEKIIGWTHYLQSHQEFKSIYLEDMTVKIFLTKEDKKVPNLYVLLEIFKRNHTNGHFTSNIEHLMTKMNEYGFKDCPYTPVLIRAQNLVNHLDEIPPNELQTHQQGVIHMTLLTFIRKMFHRAQRENQFITKDSIETFQDFIKPEYVGQLLEELCRNVGKASENYVDFLLESQHVKFRTFYSSNINQKFSYYLRKRQIKSIIRNLDNFISQLIKYVTFLRENASAEGVFNYIDRIIEIQMEVLGRHLLNITSRLSSLAESTQLIAELTPSLVKQILLLQIEQHYFLDMFYFNSKTIESRGNDSSNICDYMNSFSKYKSLRQYQFVEIIRTQVAFQEHLKQIDSKFKIYHPLGFETSRLQEEYIYGIIKDVRNPTEFLQIQLTSFTDQMSDLIKAPKFLLVQMLTWDDEQQEILIKHLTYNSWVPFVLFRFAQQKEVQSDWLDLDIPKKRMSRKKLEILKKRVLSLKQTQEVEAELEGQQEQAVTSTNEGNQELSTEPTRIDQPEQFTQEAQKDLNIQVDDLKENKLEKQVEQIENSVAENQQEKVEQPDNESKEKKKIVYTKQHIQAVLDKLEELQTYEVNRKIIRDFVRQLQEKVVLSLLGRGLDQLMQSRSLTTICTYMTRFAQTKIYKIKKELVDKTNTQIIEILVKTLITKEEIKDRQFLSILPDKFLEFFQQSLESNRERTNIFLFKLLKTFQENISEYPIEMLQELLLYCLRVKEQKDEFSTIRDKQKLLQQIIPIFQTRKHVYTEYLESFITNVHLLLQSFPRDPSYSNAARDEWIQFIQFSLVQVITCLQFIPIENTNVSALDHLLTTLIDTKIYVDQISDYCFRTGEGGYNSIYQQCAWILLFLFEQKQPTEFFDKTYKHIMIQKGSQEFEGKNLTKEQVDGWFQSIVNSQRLQGIASHRLTILMKNFKQALTPVKVLVPREEIVEKSNEVPKDNDSKVDQDLEKQSEDPQPTQSQAEPEQEQVSKEDQTQVLQESTGEQSQPTLPIQSISSDPIPNQFQQEVDPTKNQVETQVEHTTNEAIQNSLQSEVSNTQVEIPQEPATNDPISNQFEGNADPQKTQEKSEESVVQDSKEPVVQSPQPLPDVFKTEYTFNKSVLEWESDNFEITQVGFAIIELVIQKYVQLTALQFEKVQLISTFTENKLDSRVSEINSIGAGENCLLSAKNIMSLILQLCQQYPLLIAPIFNYQLTNIPFIDSLFKRASISNKQPLSFISFLIVTNQFSRNIFLSSLELLYNSLQSQIFYQDANYLIEIVHDNSIPLLQSIVDNQDLNNLDQIGLIQSISQILGKTAELKKNPENPKQQFLSLFEKLISQANDSIQVERLYAIGVFRTFNRFYTQHVKGQLYQRLKKLVKNPTPYLEINKQVFAFYATKHQPECLKRGPNILDPVIIPNKFNYQIISDQIQTQPPPDERALQYIEYLKKSYVVPTEQKISSQEIDKCGFYERKYFKAEPSIIMGPQNDQTICFINTTSDTPTFQQEAFSYVESILYTKPQTFKAQLGIEFIYEDFLETISQEQPKAEEKIEQNDSNQNKSCDENAPIQKSDEAPVEGELETLQKEQLVGEVQQEQTSKPEDSEKLTVENKEAAAFDNQEKDLIEAMALAEDPTKSQKKTKSSSDEVEEYDFTSHGYPADALILYGVDTKAFNNLDNEGKEELLKDSKKLYEQHQLLKKYTYYMGQHERNLVDKYFALLKGQQYTENSETMKEFLNSEDFTKWMATLSETAKQIIQTSIDQNLISLFPSEFQTKMKDQWKNQQKLELKTNPNAKFKLTECINRLKEEFMKTEEKTQAPADSGPQVEVNNEQTEKTDEKPAQQQQILNENPAQQLQSQNGKSSEKEQVQHQQQEDQKTQGEEENKQFEETQSKQAQQLKSEAQQKVQVEQIVDTTSKEYFDAQVTVYKSCSIKKVQEIVLNDPDFYCSLYQVDSSVINKIAEVSSINNDFKIHEQISWQLINPFLNCTLFFTSLIHYHEALIHLQRNLRHYKQFQDLQVNTRTNFETKHISQVWNYPSQKVSEQAIRSALRTCITQLKLLNTFINKSFFMELIFERLNDLQFWTTLRHTGFIRIPTLEGQSQIAIDKIVSSQDVVILHDLFEAYRDDLSQLQFMNAVSSLYKLISKISSFRDYQEQLIRFDEDQIQDLKQSTPELNMLINCLNQTQSFSSNKQEVPDETQNETNHLNCYPCYSIQDSELRVNFLSNMKTFVSSDSIKDTEYLELLIKYTRKDISGFTQIASDLLIDNLNQLELAAISFLDNYEGFVQNFQNQTGLLTMNDKNLFPDGDSFENWKEQFDSFLYSQRKIITNKDYVKRNLRVFLRVLRTIAEEEISRSEISLFKQYKDDEKKLKELLMQVLEEKFTNLQSQLYNQLFSSSSNRIIQQLNLIVEIANKFVKMVDPIDSFYEYRCYCELFKIPILFYELEARSKGIHYVVQQSEPEQIQSRKQSEDDHEFQPPKLSRLLTREEPATDLPNELQPPIRTNSKNLTILRNQTSVSNLKELFDGYIDSCKNFAQYYVSERPNQSNLWLRICEQFNLQTSIDQKFKMMREQIKRTLKDDDIEDKYDDITIHVNRDNVWASTLAELTKRSLYGLIANDFNIKYENERGIDAGGLSAEWITLVIREIMDPKVGLFIVSANKVTVQPNPHSYIIPEHLLYFRYLGRIIASALLKNLPIEVDLTRSVLKHLTKQNLYISDLEDIDPELSRNLLSLLDIDVEPLELTFNHYDRVFDELICIDLGKGYDAPVTNENKKEYVKTVANYKMTLQIKDQIEHFVGGFEDLIPRKYLKGIEAKQFGLKLSGLKYVDGTSNIQRKANDFEEHLSLTGGYTKESNEIIWLFELMRNGFTDQQKANLLFFITGSFKVHFGGFKEMGVTIEKLDIHDGFPIAHTCFKRMDMPTYSTKELMKNRLIFAMEEGSKGFYIS